MFPAFLRIVRLMNVPTDIPYRRVHSQCAVVLWGVLIGALLGPYWGLLGVSWGLFGGCWGLFGGCLEVLGAYLAHPPPWRS